MFAATACLQGAVTEGANPSPTKEDDMSSSSATSSQCDETGFKMVRDVLRTAGLRGVESAASSDMKRDASIFLTAEFRGSVRTTTGLTEALNRRNRHSTAETRSDPVSKEDAINRRRDVGGH